MTIASCRRVEGGTDLPARAAVARLTLNDFRCFRHLRIDADGEPVVLTGDNGAGKTTVLEALSFLAPGRGLRRARLDEVLRHGAAEPAASRWAVAARVRVGDDEVVEVGTGTEVPEGPTGRERRVVRIDGQAARSQSALASVLGLVWLTPDMDRLFSEGAGSRRRFLDRLVFNVDPAHADRVGAYEQALRERARLLRRGGADPAWLSTLETAMARHGVATAVARRRVAGRLAALCADDAAFPGASLTVEGAVDRWLDAHGEDECADRLRALLCTSRRIDAETGGAAAGPHKSDLVVAERRSGRAAAACSTGEQKALLIAIVLAGARLQAAERAALPVVLLDEVAAHLDDRRRTQLFGLLAAIGAQVWCTGTDAGQFRYWRGRAHFLVVRDDAIAAGAGMRAVG